MSIKKKHMNWMMLCKLPLGASLWAILFFFIFTACQDDLPETTEVMMTFTTRAVVTQDKKSDAIDVEKMKDLRVIMVREDGTIAYKEENVINGSSVTVIFNTPVKTGGEKFQFFAIANEDDILPTQNLGSIQSGDIEALKTRIVGNGSEFSINNAIPQTKYWTAKVNPYESLSVSQQLDYLVSKISVQFKNETNKAQSLSNIHITGITPNGKGRLFNHPTEEKDDKGEVIYEEVYVTTNDVTLNNGIAFDGVTNLPSGESSAIKHYYTYPVDNGNISSPTLPTLHATWNGKNYTLPLEGFAELKRNDHLKILITLTDVGVKVTYTIADWEENTTTIGGVNPTLGDNYMLKDWVQEEDVVIGEEPVEPEGPFTMEGLTISANPATIDLASATATTLTIYKPANITAITITPSDNSAFTGLSNPSSGSITDNFNITGLSDAAETVTVTLTAKSNAATGSYPLTASGTGGDDYISNVATTTITLSKTPSGGGTGIIWEKTGLSISVNQNFKETPCEIGDEKTQLSDIIKVGRIFGIEFTCTGNSGYYYKLVLVQGENSYYDDITDNQVNFDVDDNNHEFTLDQSDVDLITKENNKLYFWGNGIIITRIYIKGSL